jgi:hypothetical protein
LAGASADGRIEGRRVRTSPARTRRTFATVEVANVRLTVEAS